MTKLIIIIVLLAFCLSPFLRCLAGNIFKTLFYSVKDTYEYIRYKKWQEWTEYGITNFCGYFGRGKTLTATEKTTRLYKRFEKYGKKVRIISNYELKDVPYIPLVNFQQVVEIANQSIAGEDNGYCGTILLIDEIESLLSHRTFAKFPMELLSTISQQRKCRLACYATSQRFQHIDKLWRDLSNYVVDCHKFWRFQRLRYFDAWEVENALNLQLIRPIKTEWFFVTNKTYSQYDTSSMISQSSVEDFISNDELLMRRGSELMTNIDGIQHPSKQLKRSKRMSKRRA